MVNLAPEHLQEGTDTARPRRLKAADRLGQDLYQGLLAWRLWSLFGWNDIRQRYRRSVLGPFWITISMSVLVAVLGFIYSRIFKLEIETYLPFLALGFILWGFISASITESCEAFRENERIIKQMKIPYSIHIFRIVWRNFVVFLHTIIIFIPISIIFTLKPHFSSLLALVGLVLLCINLSWGGLILAMLSTRFRDIPQMVTTLVQITLFATPIMWPAATLGDHTLIADINPIYHFLEIVRAPLLGGTPHLLSWTVSIGAAVLGPILAIILFHRFSQRIVYWL